MRSKVISNKNSLGKLGSKEIKDLTVLKWYEIKQYNLKGFEIQIEAIPAIHGIKRINVN